MNSESLKTSLNDVSFQATSTFMLFELHQFSAGVYGLIANTVSTLTLKMFGYSKRKESYAPYPLIEVSHG